MQALELFEAFLSPLETAEIRYFTTGSVASILYGEPRLTHDIDIVLHFTKADIPKILSLFPLESYYCPPADILHIELQRRPFAHFNVIHLASGLKADFYPDADDPLHAWAFARRKRIPVLNKEMWVAPPEYVIIRKLEYFREGGSDKHLRDIAKMLESALFPLDSSFLENEIVRRGLQEPWRKCQGAKP